MKALIMRQFPYFADRSCYVLDADLCLEKIKGTGHSLLIDRVTARWLNKAALLTDER